jgi:SAM-dependent methyltransferase
VDKVPEDPAERRQWLERWAAEQQGRLAGRDPLRARLRLRLATMLEWQFHRRLDPLLDRRLKTYRNTLNPRGGHWVSSPSPWYILPRALRKIRASDRDVFVDFGCGTGRIVHQAAKRPLKRIIGVEVIPEVADRAKSLVAARRNKYRCQSIEIVTCDVAQFRVPDDLTIGYFGNVQYFSEEEMDAVLRNLLESIDRRPRRVRLIYYPAFNYGSDRFPAERFRRLTNASFGGVAIFESNDG